MNDVLTSLALVAGVRVAALVTVDGVPVVARGRNTQRGDSRPQESAAWTQDAESLGALAVGWMDALSRSVAPLTWNPPQRVVLRAARGTLVMQQAAGAVLIAVLERGASAEDLRLPMEGAIARLQRQRRPRAAAPGAPDAAAPRAPLPSGNAEEGAKGPGSAQADTASTPLHSGSEPPR